MTLSRKNQLLSPKHEIIVILHNIRSTHNVGSIFRTAEGFGVRKIIISGYTPFPKFDGETFSKTGRMPHLADKINNQIAKTALGAERLVDFMVTKNIDEEISSLKQLGYEIVALEQHESSVMLNDFNQLAKSNIALILGEEVNGVPKNLLDQCDYTLEIPMFGQKESFNVAVAAGIALYKIACD